MMKSLRLTQTLPASKLKNRSSRERVFWRGFGEKASTQALSPATFSSGSRFQWYRSRRLYFRTASTVDSAWFFSSRSSRGLDFGVGLAAEEGEEESELSALKKESLPSMRSAVYSRGRGSPGRTIDCQVPRAVTLPAASNWWVVSV